MVHGGVLISSGIPLVRRSPPERLTGIPLNRRDPHATLIGSQGDGVMNWECFGV